MSAYNIIIVPYIIFIFGLMYAFASKIFNALITVMNDYIIAGEVSAKFMTYWSLTLGIITILPFIVLIVLGIWVMRRAQEEPRGIV